jgi:Spy/CpxP family protein refolding chaperone
MGNSHGTGRLGVAVALLLALGLTALPAMAQVDTTGQVQTRQLDRNEAGLGLFCQRLDLSAEQQQAIAKLREDGQKERNELRKELMRLQNDLRGVMLQDEPSQKAAVDLVGRVGALRTQLQQSRVRQRLAVREQLTPAQRDQLLLMRGQRGPGHGKRFGEMGRAGCGGPRGHAGFQHGAGGPGRGPGHGQACGPCPYRQDGSGRRTGPDRRGCNGPHAGR